MLDMLIFLGMYERLIIKKMWSIYILSKMQQTLFSSVCSLFKKEEFLARGTSFALDGVQTHS